MKSLQKIKHKIWRKTGQNLKKGHKNKEKIRHITSNSAKYRTLAFSVNQTIAKFPSTSRCRIYAKVWSDLNLGIRNIQFVRKLQIMNFIKVCYVNWFYCRTLTISVIYIFSFKMDNQTAYFICFEGQIRNCKSVKNSGLEWIEFDWKLWGAKERVKKRIENKGGKNEKLKKLVWLKIENREKTKRTKFQEKKNKKFNSNWIGWKKKPWKKRENLKEHKMKFNCCVEVCSFFKVH